MAVCAAGTHHPLVHLAASTLGRHAVHAGQHVRQQLMGRVRSAEQAQSFWSSQARLEAAQAEGLPPVRIEEAIRNRPLARIADDLPFSPCKTLFRTILCFAAAKSC